MRIVIFSMVLTIVGGVLTLAWAAGFDPRSISIEVWWNLGLIVGALAVVAAARLSHRQSL